MLYSFWARRSGQRPALFGPYATPEKDDSAASTPSFAYVLREPEPIGRQLRFSCSLLAVPLLLLSDSCVLKEQSPGEAVPVGFASTLSAYS